MLSCQEGRGLIVSRRLRSSGKLSSDQCKRSALALHVVRGGATLALVGSLSCARRRRGRHLGERRRPPNGNIGAGGYGHAEGLADLQSRERSLQTYTASWPELHVGSICKRRSLQWGTDRLALLEPGMVGVSRQVALLRAIKPGAVLQGPVRRPPRVAAEHKSITLLHVR